MIITHYYDKNTVNIGRLIYFLDTSSLSINKSVYYFSVRIPEKHNIEIVMKNKRSIKKLILTWDNIVLIWGKKK